MFTLGTKEGETKLCGSYTYVTRRVVSKTYHCEWTIQNFSEILIYKNYENYRFEKPFFPPESNTYRLFLAVQLKDEAPFTYDSKNVISFTVISSALKNLQKHAEISLCLKSLDHVYELPLQNRFVNSPELTLYTDCKSSFINHMQWKNISKPAHLTIICNVNFLGNSLENFQKEKPILKYNVDEDISNHRNFILNDDSFNDFSFVVQDQTFHVSKIILALESPVFACMFKSEMSEGLNSKAIITDTEPEIFMKMIQFIYHQKVDQADLEKSASQLLEIAHKYDVKKLKQICVTFLYDNLHVDNALDILSLANLYSISGIKKKALRIIKLNIKLFKESEDLQNLLKENQDLFIKLIELEEESDD